MRRFAGVLLLILGGCTLGPDFHRPAPPSTQVPMPAPIPGGMPLILGQDISQEWWSVYHAPALNTLIARALANNPDLKAAKSALQAAQETMLAQQGALLPSITAGFQSARTKTPATTLSTATTNGAPLYNLHTAQLSVAYAADVFGGIRRGGEALTAEAEQQRFELEAARLTLITNLVNAVVQRAGLDGQIAALKANIDLAQRQLDIMRRLKALGQLAEADVAAQETSLAQAETGLPPLEAQRSQQETLITVLTGDVPGESPLPGLELGQFALPAALPVSLPAQLVEHRPDIRAAEASLHAASAEIGVAIANRLPNLTLSANFGRTATEFRELTSPGTVFWDLTAGVTQPLFDGGALRHTQAAAEASYAQAQAQYRSLVLTAFQNVADSLQALESDTKLLTAATRAEQTAGRSLMIAQRQLMLGDVSALGVISAEQAVAQARMVRIQAETSRLSDIAGLFQALGGGWWNRPSSELSNS